MRVNYDEISIIYDDVREEDITTLNALLEKGKLHKNSTVVDIGCGTGNYANALSRVTGASIYGLEASEGMISKARAKNKDIIFVNGDAQCMPFEGDFFDLAYMTDVIHHIPDLDKMFSEIRRILRVGGRLCIATQSHKQIDLRVTSLYFPETSLVDKKRYPDIDKIVEKAEQNGLKFIAADEVDAGIETEIDEHFLELAEKKGYSMLHLISDRCYEEGMKKLRAALLKGAIKKKTAGGTLVWFEKSSDER